MTKVVFQNQAYWLRADFWQEAEESGVDPMLVEWRNNKFVIRAITRDEFALRSGKRVAGWSVSADKSVSVFMKSLSPARRAAVVRHFQESLQIAAERVVKEFTARTGAQGKMRLPAEVGLTIVVHVEAKNGAPQLHAHIVIDPRVRVAHRSETYATHTRELYQLRKLFHSATVQEFARRLQKEFGVAVEKTPDGVRLPDVPRALCKLGSHRAHQIDVFLAKHGIKNTPVARRYGAFATRRDNADRRIGRAAFEAVLLASGFRGESICHRVAPAVIDDSNPLEQIKLVKRVGLEALRLARDVTAFSARDLSARVFETASPRHSVERLDRAVALVLSHPASFALQPSEPIHGHSRYAVIDRHQQWKTVRIQVEYVIAKSATSKPTPEPEPRSGSFQKLEQTDSFGQREQDTAGAKQKARNHDRQEQRAQPSEPKRDWSRIVEKVLRTYQVIGAVGKIGLQAAAKAIELYQAFAKPVWRVHGNGHRRTPGSVAAMARDLKKLSMYESHEAALLAMRKLNGTILQKIHYGEMIYRLSRRPKFRIPRKSLIVITDVAQAHPKDVKFILTKAKRAKAKVLFVERDWSRSVLMQHAKSMRPGAVSRFSGPEQKL